MRSFHIVPPLHAYYPRRCAWFPGDFPVSSYGLCIRGGHILLRGVFSVIAFLCAYLPEKRP